MLAALGSMYGFADRNGIVPENRRERFLKTDELERLGKAIEIAEKTGLPWKVKSGGTTSKHLTKSTNRFTKISPFAAAAIRLLIFTGCRLREILNLRWENVDLERGLLLIDDSKSGQKPIILNVPAMAVLSNLDRLSDFVIPGDNPQVARRSQETMVGDNKTRRPWRTETP